MPRKPDPKKWCEYCGIALTRKVTGGRLEDRSVFLRRKYCSLTCANSKKGRLTKHGYSWRARKHLKEACEACRAITSLQAHHLNGKPGANEAANIQTLCIHCHKFWHDMLSRRGRVTGGRMPPLF
jgi:hypothetical protein